MPDQRNIRRILIGLLLLLPSVFGQTDSETVWNLKYLLSWPPPRYTTGRNTKILWLAGDQTAMEMRKMYSNDYLAQPFILRSVLWILETAFEQPDWVRNANDREPRASISLLRSVQQVVEDKRYETAIDKLIDKLKVPATRAKDFACIDPLALSTIPINSRKQAPDLVLTDSNDKPFRLSDDKGRPVLLIVRDSKSEPWTDVLSDMQKTFQQGGLAVVGMWVDAGGRSSLDAYLRSPGTVKPDYPILLGNGNVAQNFGSGSLPMTVLIDRNGRIAAFQSSDGAGAGPLYCTYEYAINALLAEPVNAN
jgi:hypothetical protein